MKKVKRLKQTQFACPSKWDLTTEDGEEIEVRHRIVFNKPDYWCVYILGKGQHSLDVETLEGNDLKAIKEVLADKFDFSEAEIVPAPDPNEGYNWDEGWGLDDPITSG